MSLADSEKVSRRPRDPSQDPAACPWQIVGAIRRPAKSTVHDVRIVVIIARARDANEVVAGFQTQAMLGVEPLHSLCTAVQLFASCSQPIREQ